MNVKIYSRESCPYCVKAKDFFKKRNISFQEYTVGTDITSEEYNELTSMKTVPAIFIDEKLIGGYTNLIDYVVDNPEMFYGD